MGLLAPGAKENPVLLRSLHTSSILVSPSALAALKWWNLSIHGIFKLKIIYSTSTLHKTLYKIMYTEPSGLKIKRL